jgi:hypothetical protein
LYGTIAELRATVERQQANIDKLERTRDPLLRQPGRAAGTAADTGPGTRV